MELRVLFLQLAQFFHHPVGVPVLRQDEPVGEHRLQDGPLSLRLRPQPLSRAGGKGPCHRADLPGPGLLHRLKAGSGVDPYLVHLLLRLAGQGVLYPQNAACNLHVGQPVSLAVPGDLEHPGPKGLPRAFPSPGSIRHVRFHGPQKLLHSLKL